MTTRLPPPGFSSKRIHFSNYIWLYAHLFVIFVEYKMNQKNISIICIALCLILIGSYILRQNYLLEKAYKTAGIYDYIPAEESKIILEIEQISQIDSITSRLPILRRASPILSLWQEILSSARLPETSAITISFSEAGEAAIWYCMPRQKQKNLKKILPRLISNNYRPVCETEGSITVNHYALHNGSFLHVLFAPGVTAISFESSLFREAQQTVDKLSRREQFTRTRQALDSQAAARLLRQIPENSYRNSGRWQGENIYLFEKKADEKVATFSNDSTATAATTTSLSETTK